MSTRVREVGGEMGRGREGSMGEDKRMEKLERELKVGKRERMRRGEGEEVGCEERRWDERRERRGRERRQGGPSLTLKSLFWVSSSTIVPAFLQIVSSSRASATGWTGVVGFGASASDRTTAAGFCVDCPVISFKALMAASCSFWLSG